MNKWATDRVPRLGALSDEQRRTAINNAKWRCRTRLRVANSMIVWVLLLLVVLAMIALPVLAFLDALWPALAWAFGVWLAVVSLQLVLICWAADQVMLESVGESLCGSIAAPECVICGYDMRVTPDELCCPECGSINLRLARAPGEDAHPDARGKKGGLTPTVRRAIRELPGFTRLDPFSQSWAVCRAMAGNSTRLLVLYMCAPLIALGMLVVVALLREAQRWAFSGGGGASTHFGFGDLVWGAVGVVLVPLAVWKLCAVVRTRWFLRSLRESLRLDRCSSCGYDLTVLAEDQRCPECGAENRDLVAAEGATA